MSYYQNKLALVTGASEGIGKSVAKILLENGAHVVFTSRNSQKLEKAFQELKSFKTYETQTLAFDAFDVTDAESTKNHIEALVQKYGVPDLLINCAGYAKAGWVENLTTADYEGMMRLNYFGIVNVCQAMIPHFVKEKKGHIVNTSSMAGFVGLFGYTGYCASKFAVIGFSEALRAELKPFGISVSVLCPPNTTTPGLDRENETKPPEVLATEEKIKVVSPDFVAKSLLKNLSRKKLFIIPTFDGKLAYFLKRHWPWLVSLFTQRKG